VAYSQSNLDAIRAAIAKGELSVEFADRRVTYRSMAELILAEAHISQALNTSPRSKQRYGVATKGLDPACRWNR
jgi:hypothetical protein